MPEFVFTLSRYDVEMLLWMAGGQKTLSRGVVEFIASFKDTSVSLSVCISLDRMLI